LQDHGHFTFTSVTVYEIVYGLELKARAWLRGHEEVTPVADDYLAAASIKAKARRHGQSLELPDCLIAAVAIRLDVPLVTGNTADFQAIQTTGVNLIT
jgi:predicted nucleic acid-binding protein